MADNISNVKVGREGLLKKLEEWGIESTTIEHPEVFTVEQALPHISHLEGMFAKNLFLRSKKKTLYLFCAPHNADIKLNDLAKLCGVSGGLRFADECVLVEKLGLRQGAVTLFGLINDQAKDVTLVLDRRVLDGTFTKIYFHPMVNSASTAISPAGIQAFLEQTGHQPLIVDLKTSEESQN
ncbi:prolyl-tRNA synthetase associated domain-containing protein 1-like [Mizuhopecten yessoensis]|uniref:PrdX deacylase domain-containing protein 1 n=1 Tax=Mizuhopecten yessoensis TaxID=6573 RepID=A0A210Q9U2_MIZYE|nr:prolyl-tRNA synthetase associated domain-containing protein 1-like [Mizuhopecten yessoensis]OWF45517.1 Prolyl-tRNA synthetase associated domain-containing protein 1 [Mizuhopecten yessoensis]